MNKIYFIVIVLILMTNAVSAVSSLKIAASYQAAPGVINLSTYASSLSDQIVISINTSVLTAANLSYINRIGFYCADGNKTGYYNVRVLINESGTWNLIGGNYYNIAASSCLDYGTQLSFYTDSNIELSGLNDIGIGFATSSTNGASLLYGNKSTHSDDPGRYNFYIPNSSLSPLIQYINHTNVTIGTDRVDFMPILIYGDYVVPTPVATGTYEQVIPTGNNATGYIAGDFHETWNSSLPANSSGFRSLLEGQGYAATVGGFISMLQDWSLIFVMFGMILYSAKLMRLL